MIALGRGAMTLGTWLMKFAVFSFAFFLATAAYAQSVTNRVTGVVGGATSAVGGAAGQATDFSVLNTTPGTSSSVGGDWNGGMATRFGGKDVTLKGAVSSDYGGGGFKAGASLPMDFNKK
jgi:hypothetical protein